MCQLFGFVNNFWEFYALRQSVLQFYDFLIFFFFFYREMRSVIFFFFFAWFVVVLINKKQIIFDDFRIQLEEAFLGGILIKCTVMLRQNLSI